MINDKFDGRFIGIGLLLFYTIIFYLLFDKLGFIVTSAAFFSLPAMDPVFADLHVIRGAYQSVLNGYDPYIYNPYDPWNRLYNYPPIWIYLLGPFLNYTTVYVIGFTLVFLFLVSIYKFLGRLTPWQGLIAGFIVLSPTTFMVFERGNVDIIIFLCVLFSLKAFSLTYRHKPIIVSLIISFIGILKLYPLICLFYVDNNKRNYFLILVITIVLFGLYMLSIFPYFEAISENTPRSNIRSFGSAILPSIFMEIFKIEVKGKSILIALLLGNIIYIILTAFIFRIVRNRRFKSIKRTNNLVAFQLGTLIYLGTFALGNNWDYRLIFLILLLPQLFEWFESKYFSSKFIIILIAVIFIQFNFVMFSIEHHYRTLLINEFNSWITVGMLIYAYLHTLPEWLNKRIFPQVG